MGFKRGEERTDHDPRIAPTPTPPLLRQGPILSRGYVEKRGRGKELFLAWEPNYRGAISRNDASSYSVKKTLCKQGGGRGEGTHSCAVFCAKMTSLLRGHLISSALCLQSLPRGIFRIRSDEET